MSQRTLYTDPAQPCRPSTSRLPSSDSGYETGCDADCASLFEPTERTSLLAHAISPSSSSRDTLCVAEEGESNVLKAGMTPLPTTQLFVLCMCRLADPVMFTQIMPYVNEMLASLSLERERIPFYAGLAESVFALAQLATIYHWARLSDCVGRRPIIFVGAIGMALGSLCFGSAQSLSAVLLSRSLAGLFSGNVAVMHSALGELTDASNQAVAFPIYGLAWPMGSIVGPLIGGTFADPATRFPSFFTHPFWRAYPYFLPGLISAFIALAGVVFGWIYLKETLPSKCRSTDPAQIPASDEKSQAVPDSRALLRIPALRALCVSGAALSFTSTAFDVVFVLFCYEEQARGGLGFSASEIGTALSLAGVISVLIQIFLTPVLLARCNLASLYRVSCLLWAPCFLGLPLLALARAHSAAALWTGIAALLALAKLACLAYATGMILVKSATPSPTALGAANGLVQTFMCAARAGAPAGASALFAAARGGPWWAIVLGAISFGGWALAWDVECGDVDRDAMCVFVE